MWFSCNNLIIQGIHIFVVMDSDSTDFIIYLVIYLYFFYAKGNLLRPFFILAQITCFELQAKCPPSLLPHFFFFFFPDVSLQLPWLTANSFITGHKRQVLHLKGRHPPSPSAWVKNRPAGIAPRTCCTISAKWRPAGPKRWARSMSSRGTYTEVAGTRLRCFSLCSFIRRNFGRTKTETQRN